MNTWASPPPSSSSCSPWPRRSTRSTRPSRSSSPVRRAGRRAAHRAGLHIKVRSSSASTRSRSAGSSGAATPTRSDQGQEYIWVDTYTRWRVEDRCCFYQRVRDERSAQSRPRRHRRRRHAQRDRQQDLSSGAQHGPPFEETEEDAGIDTTRRRRSGRSRWRNKITRAILEMSRPIVAEFGIELVDVQIRRVNYVTEVQQKSSTA